MMPELKQTYKRRQRSPQAKKRLKQCNYDLIINKVFGRKFGEVPQPQTPLKSILKLIICTYPPFPLIKSIVFLIKTELETSLTSSHEQVPDGENGCVDGGGGVAKTERSTQEGEKSWKRERKRGMRRREINCRGKRKRGKRIKTMGKCRGRGRQKRENETEMKIRKTNRGDKN